METKPTIRYEKFGKSLEVAYTPVNMSHGEMPECFLWIERYEDWYALQSPQFKNKRVAVVDRMDWLQANSNDEYINGGIDPWKH